MEKKGQNISRLFDTGALKTEDKPIVEKYISSSQDSKATKASVIVSSLNNGMRIGLETIIDNVMKSANKEQVDAICICNL